jgi:hypothetical protein
LLGDAMCDFLQSCEPKDMMSFAEAFLSLFADAQKKTKLDAIPDFVIEAVDLVLGLCRCIIAVVCPIPLRFKSSVDDVKGFFGQEGERAWEAESLLAEGLDVPRSPSATMTSSWRTCLSTGASRRLSPTSGRNSPTCA